MKLSLCLIIAGNFFGLCASEELFRLLQTKESQDLRTLQRHHDLLDESLAQYEIFLKAARNNQNFVSKIENSKVAGDFLLSAVFSINRISAQEKAFLEREVHNKQETCLN